MSSRDEVDTVSAAALAAGGTEADDAEDYGFMYSRSFFDLDGHGWQVMWMDPAAAEQGPEAFAASSRTPTPRPDLPLFDQAGDRSAQGVGLYRRFARAV